MGYLVEGRNKHHITLNVEKSRCQEIFRELAKKSDVVIETFKPGVMDGLGIGYRQLNAVSPGLVYLSLYTYGQFGPKAACGKPDADVVNQALSGLIYMNGEVGENVLEEYCAPTKVGNWLGWYIGGLFGAYGVMLALNYRLKSGRGQFIDVSEAEALMRLTDYNINWYSTLGLVKERLGNFDIAVYPYTYVQCKDGYVFIAAYNDHAFASLAEIISRPELSRDPRFNSYLKRTRLENQGPLKEAIEAWTVNYTANEILAKIQAHIETKKGPAAAVVTGRVNNSEETMNSGAFWERGIFQRINDPYYGELLLQAPPWKMSETPPRLK